MPLIPNEDTRPCADCFKSLTGPWSTGAAVTISGERVCYECAGKREIAAIAKADRYVAYVSMDGKTINTFGGTALATVTGSKPCKLTRQSYTHSASTYRTWWAQTPDGAVWIGRGSTGIVISLRKLKGGA